MKFFNIYFLLATCALTVKSEYFSATEGLIKLSENDQIFVSELKVLIGDLEREIINLKK
jgi:hypothetical protein